MVNILAFRKTEPPKNESNIHELENDCHLVLSINQINAVAQQLGVTLDENQEFSGRIFESAQGMAHLNREVEQELQEIFDVFHAVAEHLERIGQLSCAMELTGRNSKEVLRNSLDEAVQIISEIHAINESSQQVLKLMTELKNFSSAVSLILNTVAEIADETKLLSLNASIESARAGENGAGFAVIADRIQRLSAVTQTAVSDIRKLVKQLLDSMTGVDEAMLQNSLKIKETAAKFRRVEQNLTQIQNSFEALVDQSQTVNGAVSSKRQLALESQQKVILVRSKTAAAIEQVEEVYHELKKQRSSIAELNDLGLRLNQATASLQPLAAIKSEVMEATTTRFKEDAKALTQLLVQEANQLQTLNELTGEDCASFCNNLLVKYPDLEAAWINDIKGRFLFSNPPAGIANAKVRDWFTSSLSGEEYITDPYISAITGKPCATIALPIYNLQNQVKGVLGVDLRHEVTGNAAKSII